MNEFDENFRFFVAGSGAGSMAAALYLRSVGKRVLPERHTMSHHRCRRP